MKNLCLLLALVTGLAGCAAPPVVIQVPNAHLASGQQWTYRRIDLWKNQESERFTQSFNAETGGEWLVLWTIVSSNDPQRIGTTDERFYTANHGFRDARMRGNHEPLQFPLSVGKTWTFNYQFQSNPTTLVSVTQTAVVKGWETVNVPAGTFKALKVEHAGLYTATEDSNRWTGRITETYWYAPSAQRIVAQEYKDTSGQGTIYDQRRDELVSMQLLRR